MKRIAFFIFVFSFMLFRPYQLQGNGMLYQGDDYSYFAHASSIVFGEFPSYEKEYFTLGRVSPLQSIGSSLMAVPFVFLFSQIDRLSGSSIVEERTRANITKSWSAFGYVVASCTYFILACFLLFRGLSFFFEEKLASNVVILASLFQGMPLYVFRRPFFAHSFEFFLQSLLVFILLFKEKKKDYSVKGLIEVVLILLLLMMVPTVRGNNVLVTFIWPLVLFGAVNATTSNRKILGTLLGVLMFSCIVVFAFSHSLFLRELLQDNGRYVFAFFRTLSLDIYMKRVVSFFVGVDWGLLYTTPFLLIGVCSLFLSRFKMRKQWMFCAVPILLNIYIVIHISGRNQGSYYGYRYFFPSAIPVLIYPFAIFVKDIYRRIGPRLWFIMMIIAMVPLASMLSFEGNPTTLTLHANVEGPGWHNYTYQLEVWRAVLFNTKDWVVAICKGGPLYLVYVAANIFDVVGKLPSIVVQKYQVFKYATLIKVAIIYSLPFLIMFIFSRVEQCFLNKMRSFHET